MAKRVEALWRLVLGILWYIAMLLVMPVLALLALVYFVVDVLWQLVTGGEGLPSDGGFVHMLYEWYRDNHDYVVYGKGEFRVLP